MDAEQNRRQQQGGQRNDATERERELAKREQELTRRERHVEERERQLKQYERQVQQQRPTGQSPEGQKNWPFRFLRIARNDINNDIPGYARRGVWMAYLAYLGLLVALIFQLGAATAALGVGGQSFLLAWLFSVIFLISGAPLGWTLWYKRLYVAIMKDSSVSFIMFFLFYGVNVGFSIVAAVAPPFGDNVQFAFTGWMSGITAFSFANDNSNFEGWRAVGALYCIGATLYSLLAAFSILVYRSSIHTYRSASPSSNPSRV